MSFWISQGTKKKITDLGANLGSSGAALNPYQDQSGATSRANACACYTLNGSCNGFFCCAHPWHTISLGLAFCSLCSYFSHTKL